MNRHFQIITISLIAICSNIWGQTSFTVNGRVISSVTREPVGYATVYIKGNKSLYAISDSSGKYSILKVPAGIYRIEAACVGYITAVSPEYAISATTPFIELAMDEDIGTLEGVTVRSSVLERVKESPIGKQIIGTADIEKIPGGNKDISRVIRSYPGVGYSPVGYRNDLIVRGGSPAENAFYIDGIEIPNINHFSTQGASGGPVGIINADLIEQVQFYTGALPVDQGGVLSSVMDISLKDGNLYKNVYKGKIGASEIGISGNGHIGGKTTFIYSLRQSYLQFLFKLLGLPFLPNYIDGQFKVKHRISDKEEIFIMGLAGIDNMKLNTDEEGEDVEYMLGYLPVIKQKTYTLGSAYTHYGKKSRLNISLSYSCLDNNMTKYVDNNSSTDENLMYKIISTEEKLILRGENRFFLGRFELLGGIQGSYNMFNMNSFEKAFGNLSQNEYNTKLPLFSYAMFVSANYESYNKRLDTRIGIRGEGSDYSAKLSRIWNNLSPRIQISYALMPRFTISGNIGFYHQLPALTSLGYKIDDKYVNTELEYMRVLETSAGARWNISENIVLSTEAFFKRYYKMPLSVRDGIPLACKGNDYGIVGNETLVSTAQGKAYGVELSARWIIAGKLNMLGSATIFKSIYRSNKNEAYLPSAWDNRFIINWGGTYNLPKEWSIGAKLSCIGGAPYTPYDTVLSSLKMAWDVQGRAYYNYSLYNSLRMKPFAQLDIRIDKNWYFNEWMLGAYIDLQNVTFSKLKQQDALLSTGVLENPNLPENEQKYIMKSIKQEVGSIIPSFGITVEF